MDVHGFSQSSYFLQRIFHDDFLTKASSVEISPVSFFWGVAISQEGGCGVCSNLVSLSVCMCECMYV